MSRRIVSSFWNEHASAAVPGNCSSTNATMRSASQVSTSDGIWSKEHLLQRVAGQPETAPLARDVDRAVADLDVRQAEMIQPLLVLVEPILDVDDLEEGAADHDGLLLQHLELALEVVRHGGGAPPELDDRDVRAARLEDVLP